MDPQGRRASIYLNGGTHDPAESVVSAVDLAAFAEGADHVWVNLANYARRVLPELAARGVPVWADVHDWDGENEFHRDLTPEWLEARLEGRLEGRLGDPLEEQVGADA